MMLIFKILVGILKMGLEKVQHKANLKSLKLPFSPSPHPFATVGAERIITESWDSGGGLGGGLRRVISISSQTVSSWAEESN